MTIAEFIASFERLVPPGVRYGNDTVGLHAGDSRIALSGVLVAYEMTTAIVDEAAAKKCNLIVCYHPLVFTPLLRVVAEDPVGAVVLRLEKKIAVYVAHTNFDSIPGGTSSLLAQSLGMHECRFLVPLGDSLVKIVLFTPHDAIDAVSHAVWEAGAGVIGNYDECSFRMEGIGTFFGNDKTEPAIGAKNTRERADETRLEFICPRWRLRDALRAMRAVHPYEEPAYDVYPLENESRNYGMGHVGELAVPVPLPEFVERVKRACAVPAVRYTGNARARVRTVAVVGGSGGNFLRDAVRAGADAFVTGDVRYHTFREAESAAPPIALIDAGHAETERFTAGALMGMVRDVLGSKNYSHICVLLSTKKTSRIIYA